MVKVIRLDAKPKFDVGRVIATPGVMQQVSEYYAFAALARHMLGDWGTVDEEDKATNDAALRDGHRLVSAYPLEHSSGSFWIITESDRSVTTMLLPEEY